MTRINKTGQELTVTQTIYKHYRMVFVDESGNVFLANYVPFIYMQKMLSQFENDLVDISLYENAIHHWDHLVWYMWSNFRHVEITHDEDDDDWTVYSINGRELDQDEVDIYWDIVEEKQMVLK